MTQRTDRVDALLRQEIGQILAREVADPRVGFATITDVETTPDLSHARVWVSVIGNPAEREAAVAALGRAMPFIRHELGVRLRLRRIPALHVRLDDTSERGTRLLHLLSELEAGADPAELAAREEALPTPVARLPHEGDAPEPPNEGAADTPPSHRRGRVDDRDARRPGGTGPGRGRVTGGPRRADRRDGSRRSGGAHG